MAQKELVYKVKIVDETGNIVDTLASDINTLNKSVKDLENELDNTELGSEHWKDLQKELKNSKGALDEAKASGMSFSEQLSAIPGPIGSVVQGIKGMGTAFKALLANPVALVLTGIVAALTALYKAFTSTKEGGEKMEQVMAALGAVMDVFRDVLVKVAEVLIDIFSNPLESLKEFGRLIVQNVINRFEGLLELIPALGKSISLLFKGEFAESGKVALDALGKVALGVEDVTDKTMNAIDGIKKVASEAIREGKAAAGIKKELQAIADAQRELNNRRAEQNKLIAEAKLKINDENLSYEERLQALEEVRAAEVALAEQEAALAARKYKAIKAQNALSDSSAEALDAEAAAYQAMLAAQQTSSQKQKELFDQGKALRDRQRGELKAVADFERGLRAALVTDEQEKLKNDLIVQKEADLAAIEQLKTTEEEKARLRLLAEEKYNASYEKLKKDQLQKEIEAETKRVDALLAIEAFKYDTAEELAAADMQLTIDLMRQKTDYLLANEKLTAEERLLIETQYTEGVKKLGEDVLKAKKELSDKEIQLAMQQAAAAANALNMVAQAAGESTAVGKIAAVASAYINTYLAASQALADETLPTFLKPVAVAASIALGLKQINAIMNVNTDVPKPKLSEGGLVSGYGTQTSDNIPVMVSPGESVINARSTRMFAGTLSRINQLGGGAKFDGGIISNGMDLGQMELLSRVGTKNQQPIQTYVVASQASSQMAFDRQIKNRSLV